MKTIRTYWNLAEAGFDHSLLEASGIESALLDENAAVNVIAPWSMRLQVDENDVERALDVLNSRVPDSQAAAPADPVPEEHEAPSSFEGGEAGE